MKKRQPGEADLGKAWAKVTDSFGIPAHYGRLAAIVTAAAVLLLIIVVMLLSSGGPAGDKAACTTFYDVLHNVGTYEQNLSRLDTAAGQASSEPLKSDLQAAAAGFAPSGTADFTTTGGIVLDDCANLGYPDPENG